MKYMIERRIAGHYAWVRSDSFPRMYTEAEAQDVVDEGSKFGLGYRMTPVPVKSYRRHAAVTYLELRGAKSLLESARRLVEREVNSSLEGAWAFEAFTILTTAMLGVSRHMETFFFVRGESHDSCLLRRTRGRQNSRTL